MMDFSELRKEQLPHCDLWDLEEFAKKSFRIILKVRSIIRFIVNTV